MSGTLKSGLVIVALGVALGVQWWGRGRSEVALRDEIAKAKGEFERCKQGSESLSSSLNRKIALLQQEIKALEGKRAPLQKNERDVTTTEPPSGVDAASSIAKAAGEGKKEAAQPLALQDEQKYEDTIEYLTEARIGAIGRVIPLDADQEERLRQKFLAEREAAREGRLAETESLQKILGEEYFEFYEKQKAEAFEKNKQEEVKKQVLFLSDMLEFSPDQEITLESMYLQIEDEISERQKKRGKSLQELVANSRLRQLKRLERISQILSAEQLKTYAEYSATSPDSDMIMWHSPEQKSDE